MINNSFRIRYGNIPAAISLKTDNCDVIAHNHPEIEILAIEKGSSRVIIGGVEYDCRAGDILFVDPMEVHSIKVTCDNYVEKCICFDTSLIIDNGISQSIADEELRLEHHIFGESEHGKYLREYILKCYDALYDKSASFMEISAYLSLIVSYMLKNGLTTKNRSVKKSERFCTDALKYISEHFTENITSKNVAAEFNYDHSYFCRRFAEGFGINFSAYLCAYRIAYARKLAEDGEKRVSELAAKCGFSDPLYFSKCFKRLVGILPSEYLKSQYSTDNR